MRLSGPAHARKLRYEWAASGIFARGLVVNVPGYEECSALARRGTVVHCPLEEALTLPAQSGTAVLVVSFGALDHLPPADQPAFVDELWRVLKPGGRLRLSVAQAGALRRESYQHYPMTVTLLQDLFQPARWRSLRWYSQMFATGGNPVLPGLPHPMAEVLILEGVKSC